MWERIAQSDIKENVQIRLGFAFQQMQPNRKESIEYFDSLGKCGCVENVC